MVTVDHAIVARLSKEGHTFEVLVDCDQALLYKEGKDIDLADVLAAEVIFSDAKKGLRASEILLKQLFGTSDPVAVAQHIIKTGQIQLTVEHRAKMREEKRKRILAYLNAYGADPRTHLPHPLVRLELAFQQVKVHIDENKSDERLIEEILKQLRPILPIKLERKELEITIPATYAGKAFTLLKTVCTVKSSAWNNDGSLQSVVEVPAGLQDDVFDKLNKLTHGTVESKTLRILE